MMSSQLQAMDALPPPPLLLAATPPLRSDARHQPKPTAPYLAVSADGGVENHHNGHNCPSLTPPPSKTKTPISPSPLHLSIRDRDAPNHAPLRELLLLPTSPVRRPKSRRLRLDMENVDPDVEVPRRRRSKSRVVTGNVGLMGCASPRRRSRRRLEKDEREQSVAEENVGKVRGRRWRSRPADAMKEEILSLVAPVVSSDPLSTFPTSHGFPALEISNNDNNQSELEGVWRFISELVMWRDVAKSSLWFGFGSLFFLSSCFSKNYSLSIISAISHLGLFILAIAFFYDSFSRRRQDKRERRRIQLNEENILRATRVILPTANAAIAMTQDVFSGEPSMTLKVAPVLLFAAKYGHLITLWRLCVAGFFISFTVPKLYSRYYHQIQRQAVNMSSRVSEAWKACQHKRVAALSAGTIFWNMFGVKTRVLAAFIAIVMIRYHRQFCQVELVDEGMVEAVQQEQQASTIAEEESN